jgi:hypothetical protein
LFYLKDYNAAKEGYNRCALLQSFIEDS